MTAKKILVVDDDRDQQAGLRVRLTASGYQVVSAFDAIQAVNVARSELPDLILLDIGLPGGDGHKVFQRLRNLAPTSLIPVIILSAMDPAGHRDRLLGEGANAYFQKPADNSLLLDAINSALGAPGADQSSTQARQEGVVDFKQTAYPTQ